MKAHLIWLVTLALAGCKKGVIDMRDASVSEVADRMRKSGAATASLKPGLWQATLKLDKVSAPGAPEVERQLQANAGQARTMAECLTDATARKPFDRFIEGVGDECRYAHFRMGGGSIDNKLVCNVPGGSRTTATRGTYGLENYALKISSDTRGSPVAQVVMDMSLDARRVGACPK